MRSFRGLSVLLLPLMISLAWSTSLPAVVIEKVMGVVNGEIITLTEVQEQSVPLIRKMALESSDRSGMPRVDDTERQVLERLIDQRLQLQEARSQGITTSAGEIDSYIQDLRQGANLASEEDFQNALAKEGLSLEKLKKDVGDHLTILKIVGKEVRSKVIISEQEVHKAYEEEIDKYVEPSQVRLRYILISLTPNAGPEVASQEKRKAEEVLFKLKKGGDFSEIAKVYSSGPNADTGGDIGFVKKGELHPDLDKTAFSLPPGQISDLIPLPSGFVILKVEERRTPFRPYSEVAEQIRAKVYAKRVEEKYQEWSRGLRAKAYIETK
jgi:peptidyl-prolyl cis-trans isomerase SurA